MSKRELDRAQLLLLVRERRRTLSQVAEQLGLSVRQVERLYRAFKTGGAPALVSRKRGRPSPRRLPEEVREAVLELVRSRYRLHDLEPFAYLRDLFCLLPSWPRHQILDLAPAYWQQTLQQQDAQKRLDANIFRQVALGQRT